MKMELLSIEEPVLEKIILMKNVMKRNWIIGMDGILVMRFNNKIEGKDQLIVEMRKMIGMQGSILLVGRKLAGFHLNIGLNQEDSIMDSIRVLLDHRWIGYHLLDQFHLFKYQLEKSYNWLTFLLNLYIFLKDPICHLTLLQSL